MESYSQCGQDIFVLNLLGEGGSFLDLGCYLPKKINNTYLLEKNGWSGLSIDIEDYSKQWESRKNKFIQMDCLTSDYKSFLDENPLGKKKLIDYLSIDMENLGDRYRVLDKIMSTGYDFKIITIEHDSHLGNEYILEEKNKQITLLKKLGYYLLCEDVSNYKNPEMFYEDWWINPNFIEIKEVEKWRSKKSSCNEIFSRVGIEYNINDISKNWDDYKL
jgi:hypothetical protein